MLMSQCLALFTILYVCYLRNNIISSHHGRCLALDEAELENLMDLHDIETVQGTSGELNNGSNDQLSEEWDTCKIALEEEFQNFMVSLENNIDDTLLEGKNEWDEWIQKMQYKWSHYHELMSETYKSYIYERSATWSENDWKRYIEIDWHRWINNIEDDLSKLIQERWEQWKAHQMMTWLMSNWKDEKQNYIDKLESRKYSNTIEMKLFMKKCNKIIQWKTEKWESWIQDKEDFITNLKNEKFLQWKDDYYFLFNNCRSDFIENWINKK
ncbi:hypothetical protein C922_05229 [Plasmodium inui San Antonio 1]|uniref:Tryptophan/threonine-rich plasmodium antigen C-terminal domain-containing protein n=1 Tax=Plasmodium inui San Antonio 1 TaxID=1237626 RepID=W7A5L4_9APIC|nr:hypothetical protein C922_05229 [Plasmodium inui San Antonio 1]EUD64379.1 hypothetical protein C922_05229 [Plasmodium inui San Antonio 1]